MISKKFGFIQGRLSRTPSPKILQYFPQKNWKNEIKVAKKNNFSFIEYFGERKFNKLNPMWNRKGLREIKSLTKKSKLQNYSFCDDFFINNNILRYKNLDSYVEKIIKSLNFLSIKIYVLALFEKTNLTTKNYKNYISTINYISKKLETNNIKLVLETNLETEYLLKLLKSADNNCHLVYDTGNRLKKKKSQYKEIIKLKKKIIHIHLKDKNYIGQNVVIGTGKVNFELIFKSLKKINYKGNFVFETNRGKNPIVTMKNNLKFIRDSAKNAGYKL
jgi:sugar phosphate isomerase/epimerase